LLIKFSQLLQLVFFLPFHLLDFLGSHTLPLTLGEGGSGLSLPKPRVMHKAQEFTIGS
jgi:hypothetical protein